MSTLEDEDTRDAVTFTDRLFPAMHRCNHVIQDWIQDTSKKNRTKCTATTQYKHYSSDKLRLSSFVGIRPCYKCCLITAAGNYFQQISSDNPRMLPAAHKITLPRDERLKSGGIFDCRRMRDQTNDSKLVLWNMQKWIQSQIFFPRKFLTLMLRTEVASTAPRWPTIYLFLRNVFQN